MADKISILELQVNLDCHKCYKKIKKAVIKCYVCYEWHAVGHCKRGGCHRPMCCKVCCKGCDDGHCKRGGDQKTVCCKKCYKGHGDGYCKVVGGPQYYYCGYR